MSIKKLNEMKMKKLMNSAGVIFLALIFLTRCSNHSNDTKGQTLDVGSSKIEEKFVPEAENVKPVQNEKEAISETLQFSDGSGKYELQVIDNNIKIIYQYLDYTEQKPEIATIKNNKIYTDYPNGSDIYKIKDNKLCVYNPETDDYDCFEFLRDKSTCDLKNLFKL